MNPFSGIRGGLKMLVLSGLVLSGLLLLPHMAQAETGFTYQGRLSASGAPAQGSFDFLFKVYSASGGGTQLGSTLTRTSVNVEDGVFTVMLDFGELPFSASPRWLDISVRTSGAPFYTVLSPRQQIGAAPFAIETLNVASDSVGSAEIINGSIQNEDLANSSVDSLKIQNSSITSADVQNGTLTGFDVDGWLYTKKSELEERTAVTGGTEATAACDDANDLPLSWSMTYDSAASNPAPTVGLINWTSTTQPASVRVQIYPCDFGSCNLNVKIICIPVP